MNLNGMEMAFVQQEQLGNYRYLKIIQSITITLTKKVGDYRCRVLDWVSDKEIFNIIIWKQMRNNHFIMQVGTI